VMATGFAFPFCFNSRGGVATSSGADRKVTLTQACVLTNRGARFRQPQLGVVGYRPLFRALPGTMQHMMRFFIREAVQAEVPDVLVGDVQYRQVTASDGTKTVGDIAILDTETDQARWASAALGGHDGDES